MHPRGVGQGGDSSHHLLPQLCANTHHCQSLVWYPHLWITPRQPYPAYPCLCAALLICLCCPSPDTHSPLVYACLWDLVDLCCAIYLDWGSGSRYVAFSVLVILFQIQSSMHAYVFDANSSTRVCDWALILMAPSIPSIQCSIFRDSPRSTWRRIRSKTTFVCLTWS